MSNETVGRGFRWSSLLIIITVALLDAIVAFIFVYNNDFAPDGVLGLATMLQHFSGLNVGIFMLLLNAPLLVFAAMRLSRSYAIYNFAYVVVFIFVSLVARSVFTYFGLTDLIYTASSTEMLLIVAIGYGAFSGLAYAMTVMRGGSTGGTDILASLVNMSFPHFNTVWIIFAIKVIIAVFSFFVYGMRLMPVIVSMICSFACGLVSDSVLKGRSTALRFEVITTNPRELADEIMTTLDHGCTAVAGVGMYEGGDKTILICVINRRQRVDFEQIIKKYPDTFAYCCPVKQTYGDFTGI